MVCILISTVFWGLLLCVTSTVPLHFLARIIGHRYTDNCAAVPSVFFVLRSMTDHPGSAAQSENGRLNNKEDNSCITLARSHINSEKLAKKVLNDDKPRGGGGLLLKLVFLKKKWNISRTSEQKCGPFWVPC